MFGEFIKRKRVENNMTLRDFCRALNNEDSGNWSRVERKIIAPPQNDDKLKKIADILKIDENSDDWFMLFDSAKTDAGHLPEYIKEEENVMDFLPAFFRTVKNVKPTREELMKLVEDLKKP